MLELHTFAPAFGQPSPSPFCIKAIVLLQMAGLEWKPKFDANLMEAPMQKFPVLIDGKDVIADSTNIQHHLETEHGADFGSWLSSEQLVTAHALTRMSEEHLYYVTLNDRWNNDANWKHVRPLFFSDVPEEMTNAIRKQVIDGVMWHGIGRFPQEILLERAEADIDTITKCLGEKAFLFGERASFADAAIAPQLASMAASPEPSPFADLVNSRQSLVHWIGRISDSYYPADMKQAA